jgi:hypothetical protein
MIQFKDTENGQYKSSNEAISFAIATAQKLGMRGERAHVCVLDGDGRLRCKWSYDREIVTCARIAWFNDTAGRAIRLAEMTPGGFHQGALEEW